MKKSRLNSPTNVTSKSESVTEREPVIWDGVTKSVTLTEQGAKVRQDLADFAKNYNWPKVLDILTENPELVNTTRPGGHSLYAPLHQAAHGGANIEVVTALLKFGAFRTLKNSEGKRAVDVARIRSYVKLVQILEPVYEQHVPATVLSRIQGSLHAVIHERAHRLVEEHALRLPELEPILEFARRRFWFAVPGMYGGFAYWLADSGPNAKLISESWCRVVGGSGQRHEITGSGSTLVDEGFV
jgi:hypothetical protein